MRNYATFKNPRDKKGYEVGNDSYDSDFTLCAIQGQLKIVDQYRLGALKRVIIILSGNFKKIPGICKALIFYSPRFGCTNIFYY